MNKFAVFSGFLGSGKTSTMIALTKYCTERYAKASMISNDLGSQSLADNKFALLSGCSAGELTGGCICYQTENLVARLSRLFDDEGCELVISDIPGFGVGALEHVYHTLAQHFPARCALAPFTVLVEPRTLDILREPSGDDIEYILRTQLVEADLIVLNKCDLLTNSEREAALAFLRENFPAAQAIAISALTGEGIDELSLALLRGSASMRRPDIGYGGESFGKAMGKISEFYLQYYATVCCNDFDGSAYLLRLAEDIRSAVAAIGCEIPHLKLLAWEPEGDFAKADLIGISRAVELPKSFAKPCTELGVMLNASAVCPPAELDRIISAAVDSVSRSFNLDLIVYGKESFGMGN